ncbi:MAG: DUF2300 domain-containing protein [Lysobacterales bacterium]
MPARALLLVLALGWAQALAAGSAGLELAVWQQGRTQLLLGGPGDISTLTTPLGSLWKLYVHAWLVDTAAADAPYRCRGGVREEVYCCEVGEEIHRDQALVRSCGLYYEARRAEIDRADWSSYWRARHAPDWLVALDELQPGTQVPVDTLLATLADLPAQVELRRVLLDVSVTARDPAVIGHLGGVLRAKTWSWRDPLDPARRIGGFAGWLVDGTPVWARAAGSSQQVLSKHALALAAALRPAQSLDAGECVDVRLFARYPIRRVLQNGRGVRPGALQGRYTVEFANGNTLDISSLGETFLAQSGGVPELHARISREDYVARVIDREADARQTEAARALAVAIRSYLKQNAGHQGSCLTMQDSSAQQRVAPRPASPAARAVAASTADLILADVPVRYHLDQSADGQLNWTAAQARAAQGARFDQILREVWPRGSLSRWDGASASCRRLEQAAEWLKRSLSGWRARLDQEPGYAPTREFDVCLLRYGRPYVDRERRRLYVRGLQSLQDRLDLTHEYLHLAFSAHPNGLREDYIEGLAQTLLLE